MASNPKGVGAYTSPTAFLCASASFVRSPTKSRVVHSAVLSLDRFLLVRAIPLACNLAVIGLAYGMLLAFAAVYGRQVGAQSTGLFFTLMAIGMMAARAFSGRLVDGGKVIDFPIKSPDLATYDEVIGE